jgi:uncharacterized protein YndB with AHSA1/START domain
MEVKTRGSDELVLTRFCKAPPSLVWDAHTKPELIKRWLTGPPGWSLPVCEVDLRVGGKWRYVWANDNGESMSMGGTHLEIEAPTLLVMTQLFDPDWIGGDVIGRLELQEVLGGTRLVNTLRYPSEEVRAAALQSGMASGIEMGYQDLDLLLEELSAQGGNLQDVTNG